MSDDTTHDLQLLLRRIQEGDAGARRQLMERAYYRLRRLTGSILYASYPALQDQHELDSILNDSWIRLVQALEKTEPPTVVDFFRLAAHKIRQVMLDLVERSRLRRQREVPPPETSSGQLTPLDPQDTTLEPSRLAQWTEFHRQVESLPVEERTVFELHYYLELPQAEIARLLELHPRKVSRLWITATEKLADRLPQSEQTF